MHFGATLRLLRTNAGWTLRDLAERLGVSNAYLSRVENGHDAPPTPDRLSDLAVLLHVPGAKLIEFADRVAPAAPNYLAGVPAARELFLELVRRELTPIDLARVRAFVEREFPLPGKRVDRRNMLGMLSHDRVILSLACRDLGDVIDLAAVKLASGAVRASKLVDAIRARERDCPSALGGGLAVPYAIVPNATPAAVIVTLRSPLRASTPDNESLRVVIVHHHRGPPDHTRLLAQMAQLADQAIVASICGQATPKGLLDAIGKVFVE